MYEVCFGAQRRPFASQPRPDTFFPAAAIDTARSTIARTILRGEGTALVIGPSGTGKTLLLLTLAEQFSQTLHVAMLNSGRLGSRKALFQAILYELGRPYRGMDEGELRLALVDYLEQDDQGPRGLALLVDEAHTLPMRLLDELRLLGNLARDGQPLVRLALAGAPPLEERLASPRLDSFNQRIVARCYLENLNRTETRDYIWHQIDAAGQAGQEVFSAESCQSVYQATGGVPRLINQVCDHAMLLAYVAGREAVEPADVEEAWADLQQLPLPGNEPADRQQPGVIEFGALEDAEPDAAEKSASPMFRVTSLDEEAEAEPLSEPTRQIHRIERLLAEADDDFQPAGKISPEVELRFDKPQEHPFQEQYEQEEVVADRYAHVSTSARGMIEIYDGSESAADKYSAAMEAVGNICPRDGQERANESSQSDEMIAEPLSTTTVPAASAAAPHNRPRDCRRLFSRLYGG
jgi:type II secretory pathway predicted ATPase ExeA